MERDFAKDEKQATTLTLNLRLLNWTENNIRNKIFESTDEYRILSQAYLCPTVENGTGRAAGAAQIMSYSVPTPGATFGLCLNALNNRVYKIILSLKGVAAADRFEIEVDHFLGFNSSLI